MVSKRTIRGYSAFLLAIAWTALGLVGCEEGKGDKSGQQTQPKPGNVDSGDESGSGSAPVKLVFEDFDVLQKKVEVTAYHLLVKDRGEDFSGYCIASSKDPQLPQEALKSFVVKEGPCPSNLSIDGSKSNIAYVCKPIKVDAATSQQVILYGKLQVIEKYEDIRQLKPEIVLAFCGNPHQ